MVPSILVPMVRRLKSGGHKNDYRTPTDGSVKHYLYILFIWYEQAVYLRFKFQFRNTPTGRPPFNNIQSARESRSPHFLR